MGARRELVEIHARSNLAQVAARDAAAVRGLADSADSLSGSAVQTDRDTQRMNRSLSQTSSAVAGSDRSIRRQSDTINQLTGRIRVLADVAAILGPALAPIGALAVPAVTGLANQLGFAAAAAGTAVLAFQGVGDAVTAMNDYALSPTAENAEKVQEALTKLSPAAAQFAREVSSMRDQFAATRDAAAEGLFGGLTPALDDLDGLLGRVQPVLREIGSATGDMLADGLESLNSDRWQPFFDFLQAEARPVLTELGGAVGDFGHGLAELWMAFQPLNRDFSGWIRDVASSFDGWAAGLAETEGFNDFIAYIRESGPQVASALGALGGALVDIVTAASPLGGPVLAGIEAFSKAVSAIADSPIGPVLLSAAAAMALFNRAMAVGTRVAAGNFFATTAANVGVLTSGMQRAQTQAMSLRSSLAAISANRSARALPPAAVGSQAANQAAVLADNAERARSSLAGMAGAAGRTIGPLAGLGLAMSGAADDMALSNSAMLALLGSAAGIPGALGGAAIGSVMDMAKANDDLQEAILGVDEAIQSGKLDAIVEKQREVRDSLLETSDAGNFWEATLGGGLWDRVYSDLSGATDDGIESYKRLSGAATEAGGANSAYASETQQVAGAAAAAASNVARLSRQLEAQAENARTAFGAQTNWSQAVRNARDALRQGEKGLRGNSQAAIDNRNTLQGLADAWSDMPPKVQNNIDRFRSARSEFIKTARGMGATAGEARNLANRMLGVPKKVLTKVDADVRQANRGLGLTEGQINKLSKKIAKPKVTPDISKAQRNLGNMRGRLDEIGSQRVSPKVDVNDSSANRKLSGVNRGMSRLAGLRSTGTADLNDNPINIKLRNVDFSMKRTAGLKATTNVDANTAGANSNLGGHASYLSSLNGRTANTYVNNYVTTVYRTRNERAGGGPVVGSRRRAMGLVTGPGTSTSDSVELAASAGEWVHRAKAVNYYGQPMMRAINDMQIDRRALVEAASSSRSAAQRVSFGNATATVMVRTPDGQSYPASLMWDTATEAVRAFMDERDEDAYTDSTRYAG